MKNKYRQGKNIKEIKYKSLEVKKQENLINNSIIPCSARLQKVNSNKNNKDKYIGLQKVNKNRRRFLT